MTKLISKALIYLSKREYSRIELESKLMLISENQVEINDALDYLEQYGYQSDRRYIESYVRYKSKTFGLLKIRYELKKRVKDFDLINEVINSLCLDEIEIIQSIVKKKYNNSQPAFEKIIRYLMSKGFNVDSIYKVLKNKN